MVNFEFFSVLTDLALFFHVDIFSFFFSHVASRFVPSFHVVLTSNLVFFLLVTSTILLFGLLICSFDDLVDTKVDNKTRGS